MIKLFSLNHTRIRRFSILAQDKTQFRRVTVLIFRIRNTSASAHTNYLVNFLKSVRDLPDQGGAFYIESLPCQPFILTSALNRKTANKFKRLSFNFWPASVAFPSKEMRILQSPENVSTRLINYFYSVSVSTYNAAQTTTKTLIFQAKVTQIRLRSGAIF